MYLLIWTVFAEGPTTNTTYKTLARSRERKARVGEQMLDVVPKGNGNDPGLVCREVCSCGLSIAQVSMRQRQAAAVRMLLSFFRLSILPFEIREFYIQRLVSEPDSDRPYAGPLHLTSG